MPRISAAIVLLLAPSFLWGQPGSGEVVQTYGPVTIKELWSPRPVDYSRSGIVDHGYVEYRFQITNSDAESSQTVRLVMPGADYRSSDQALRVTKTLEIPAGATLITALYQPNIGFAGGSGEIPVDVFRNGQRERNPIRVVEASRSNEFSNRYYYGRKEAGRGGELQVTLLASPKAAEALNDLKGKLGPRSGPTLVRMEDSVKNMSTNWLAYSSLDGMVLTAKDLEKTTPEVRTAIYNYVEAGGSLTVLGQCKLPDSWSKQNVGNADFLEFSPGFGYCVVCNASNLSQLRPADLDRVIKGWNATQAPWDENRGFNYGQMFQVVERRGLPIVTLLLFLILFTFLVGPLNLYVLSRFQKRIWMLWTIPTFSLVATLLIFSYMMLYEGWQSYTRIEAVTVLDETSQTASSIGVYGIYAPLTPGNGLTFDTTTEVSPVSSNTSGRYGYSNFQYRTMDWTAGQHLASGWVTARVSTYFRLRKVETRRERLLVSKTPQGEIEIVNGLKGTINKLWLADKNGKVYKATDIDSGAKSVLNFEKQLDDGGSQSFREIYSRGNWTNIRSSIEIQPHLYLRPNTYVAIMDGTPFIEPGLPGAIPRDSSSVVFGILRESENEN